MEQTQEAGEAAIEPARIVGRIRNLGDPIRFANVENLCGFAAEAARGGETVKLWTRLALTSEEPMFHRLAEGFESVVNAMAQRAGKIISLSRANTVLLVIKADNTAELWVDTAAETILFVPKRNIAYGTVVFENDIADVTGKSFPCVNIEASDRVLCLFREAWSFAFAFDFNPDGII